MKNNQFMEYQLETWTSRNIKNPLTKSSCQYQTERTKYYMKLGLCSPRSNKSIDHVIPQIKYKQDKLPYDMNILIQKTVQQIRKDYLNKLLEIGLLKQYPSKKHQTIMIYDWDDTILCTSYINDFRFVWLPTQVKILMNQLDEYAAKLLYKSKDYGKVFIITNAAQGWVQSSSEMYLPLIYECIKKQNIQIISARNLFQDEYPGDSYRWKVQAFKTIKSRFDKNIITNLICVGDSKIEMDAAHILAKQFKQVLVKTIKLRENPRPEQLIKQHELVYEKFEQIYISTTNLAIKLQRKK